MKRILLSLAFAIAAGGAQAQTEGRPVLLVASPALQGLYSQTALIALPAGDRHIGFIADRAPGQRPCAPARARLSVRESLSPPI